MNTNQNFAQNADAQDAAQAATAKAAKECACGNYGNATTGQRLVCDAETTRTFAPGHDARLKGFLIRAGREGHQVTLIGHGEPMSAQDAAKGFGFAEMVRDGIARPAKARKAKATAPAKVVGKVGRWSYEGTVTAGGKIFTYTDRKGATLMAEKFTIVG